MSGEEELVERVMVIAYTIVFGALVCLFGLEIFTEGTRWGYRPMFTDRPVFISPDWFFKFQ